MFHLFPRRSREHVVANGRVGCPLRRCDVEVDLCLDCQWFEDMESNKTFAVVRCERPRQYFSGDEYVG